MPPKKRALETADTNAQPPAKRTCNGSKGKKKRDEVDNEASNEDTPAPSEHSHDHQHFDEDLANNNPEEFICIDRYVALDLLILQVKIRTTIYT